MLVAIKKRMDTTKSKKICQMTESCDLKRKIAQITIPARAEKAEIRAFFHKSLSNDDNTSDLKLKRKRSGSGITLDFPRQIAKFNSIFSKFDSFFKSAHATLCPIETSAAHTDHLKMLGGYKKADGSPVSSTIIQDVRGVTSPSYCDLCCHCAL